jgi:predicted TIM-barrel fold metal-dependent hydrolase
MTPDDVQMLETGALPAEARLRRVDCDVHHALPSLDALKPFLAKRWWDHLQTYGLRMPVPFSASAPYPKATPALSRTDAWPPEGGPPGSDLAFMQEQLLDRYDIQYGMLHLLYPCGMDQRNQAFGAALCRAINEWVVATWTDHEPRLKAAISLPGEDAESAVAEIDHWAGHPGFAQVAMATHSIEPLGRRRYWPIYEAAVANGYPVGLHTSGYNGTPVTPAGWASFYVEEQHATAISQQGVAISLVTEGVFARLPELRVVVVEAGFAWVPSVAWRLDRHWEKMRDEVPHLTRPPSEYIRENLWFTTQPMDEPERARDLRHILDWIGWDRVLFASDYPHWDMDSPELGIKLRMTPQERRMIYGDNARAVYGLT